MCGVMSTVKMSKLLGTFVDCQNVKFGKKLIKAPNEQESSLNMRPQKSRHENFSEVECRQKLTKNLQIKVQSRSISTLLLSTFRQYLLEIFPFRALELVSHKQIFINQVSLRQSAYLELNFLC